MTPLEQLQEELKELLSNRNDDGDLDTSDEEFEALIAKAFLAGEKREEMDWKMAIVHLNTDQRECVLATLKEWKARTS